ncbi:hypothetical protein [Leifsonia sp. NPDC080035]|uniref:Gfo/Idh/MocA family oxidoreductase n=1 Tax=Leifsonia sp. NPDC080035 TaxID=3143936 RepID=A0AAU7GDD3_9MICO
MTGRTSGLRVAFAGVAHSHPWADAANLVDIGATVSAVWDADDPARRDDFAERFGAAVAPDPGALLADGPDLVVATPRTPRAVAVAAACAAAGIPVFLNKTVAASEEAVGAFDRLDAAGSRFSTASVLRFAPAVAGFAERVDPARMLAVEVSAQHDIAGFLTPERDWQDDPAGAGGTILNVGLHAFELLDAVIPGARPIIAVGRSARGDLPTRSETVALALGSVHGVPLTVSVSGVPGPDRYAIRVLAPDGAHELVLGDGDDLGYTGLARRLVDFARGGDAPVAWRRSRESYRAALELAALTREPAPVLVAEPARELVAEPAR